VLRGKHIVSIKSAKAMSYKASAQAQVARLKPLDGDLWIEAHIFYASRRPDLDPSIIWDALQGHAYHNDRQLKEQHLFWGLDKENPRAEISIGRIEAHQKDHSQSPSRSGGRRAKR